jgi:hypothetical protein
MSITVTKSPFRAWMAGFLGNPAWLMFSVFAPSPLISELRIFCPELGYRHVGAGILGAEGFT